MPPWSKSKDVIGKMELEHCFIVRPLLGVARRGLTDIALQLNSGHLITDSVIFELDYLVNTANLKRKLEEGFMLSFLADAWRSLFLPMIPWTR